ncbi:MAG: alpha/beta fold hydrolase [Phycisphaeraceae bacterium]
MPATVHEWTLSGADNQPIHGNTHLPDEASRPRGVLILCHGFKGYKDYGFFPRLAQHAADAGLIAHRFNFSHSGMTNRLDIFERPDLFEHDTFSRQVHDLRTVDRAVRSGDLPGSRDVPIVWFGHSRGGITVLITAGSGETTTTAPAGVIAASAPHLACHLDDAQQRLIKKLGRLPSPSSRTGQELHVGRAWLDEIEADPARFDPVLAAARLPCPALFVHGDADLTVPVEASRILSDAAGPRGQLEIISGASHTFDAPNPLPADTPLPAATRRMIELVCGFARQF